MNQSKHQKTNTGRFKINLYKTDCCLFLLALLVISKVPLDLPAPHAILLIPPNFRLLQNLIWKKPDPNNNLRRYNERKVFAVGEN